MKKIGGVIYYYGKKYKEIGRCAKNSFRKHHPDIALHHVGDHNKNLYDAQKRLKHVPMGARKYMFALEIMKKNQYDKLIVLGADTITCDRLDEFLNDDRDVLVTLDYPYQLETHRVKSPDDQTHVNADVVCFNNINVIVDIVKLAGYYPIYGEQGALNEVLWSGDYNYTHNIVDGPYDESKVVYNARAKGNICAGPGEKPWGKFTNQFYVKDNKLFTGDHKQIKVWHYCDGFGTIGDSEFKSLINKWIFDWFNRETKTFFKEECDCGDFFEREFAF